MDTVQGPSYDGRMHRVQGRLGWVLLLAVTALALPGPATATPREEADNVVAVIPSPIGPLSYKPAQGLHVADTGLVLGGYSSVSATVDEGEPARFSWDELSFLVNWRMHRRLTFFSEFEFEDFLTIDEDGNGGRADSDLQLERLYVDLNGTDALNVRVGKFLTPIGRWNLVHAQPLVWTTSRPVVTEEPFDQHVTGVMLHGSVFPGPVTLGYSLYGQFTDQLEPVEQPVEAERAGGARFEFEFPGGPAGGMSYLALREDGDWHHLAGMDAELSRGPVHFLSEILMDPGEADEEMEWGAYAQLAVETLPSLFAVVRYEVFDAGGSQPTVHLVDLGLTYRLTSFCVLKTEYLIASTNTEDVSPGFKSSVAILF